MHLEAQEKFVQLFHYALIIILGIIQSCITYLLFKTDNFFWIFVNLIILSFLFLTATWLAFDISKEIDQDYENKKIEFSIQKRNLATTIILLIIAIILTLAWESSLYITYGLIIFLGILIIVNGILSTNLTLKKIKHSEEIANE